MYYLTRYVARGMRTPILKDLYHFCRLFDASVDVTQLFSLREHAIAKEPGSSYVKPWRCVSRLGLVNGGLDSLESSPYGTLSRGAFSASSLVTPIPGRLPGLVVPVCNSDS